MTTTNKYLRRIIPAAEPITAVQVDVYAVLEAFGVACPAVQHAVKKLLCAGLRGKNSVIQDLKEARQSIDRAVEMELRRSGVHPVEQAVLHVDLFQPGDVLRHQQHSLELLMVQRRIDDGVEFIIVKDGRGREWEHPANEFTLVRRAGKPERTEPAGDGQVRKEIHRL